MRRNSRFTLVEVVVALAILGVALTVYFTMNQNAQRRLDKARTAWERFHVLSQAAEYYLLFPGEETGMTPPELELGSEYSVECRYEDADGLPDDYRSIDSQAPLRCMVLELIRNADREVVDTLKIDRIIYETDTLKLEN